MPESPIVVQGIPIDPDISCIGQPVNEIMYNEEYVVVNEITPEGWLCIICGCFFCPGLNLLGFCMTDKRIIPANR